MHTDTDVTGAIIGAALRVSNSLGCGFLEKAYETALGHELRKSGLCVETQRSFVLTYDDVVIGEYRADLIVQDEMIVEVKAAKAIDAAHAAQLLNYLKATGLRTGLILNFGTARLGIKRMVL